MVDLEIEDFGSSGADLTDEEGSGSDGGNFLTPHGKSREATHASSLFHVGDPGPVPGDGEGEEEWEKDSDGIPATRQISLLERDAESEMDSDEERDIMLEIKNEITQKVKAEMKEELAMMKRQIEKQSGANDDKDEDLKNLDPDLKMAILKMRKLDRILAKKEKREKEVKRDRILLQARLKKELAELKPEGRDDIKEVQVNTSKYLALTLPPSHNLGIRISERGELEEDTSPPVTPVFTTQVPDDGPNSHRKSRGSKQSHMTHDEDGISVDNDSQSTVTSAASGDSRQRSKKSGKSEKRKNKDFIKRNIQLAADAGESVAMTDDEKARIGDLLADLDTIPDFLPGDEDLMSNTAGNPYEITLSVDEGFHPSHAEITRLEAIDLRLRALMPRGDYESIASTPRNLTRQTDHSSEMMFTRTHALLDVDQPGELALQETKEHRDLNQRLKAVESQLNRLTNTEYNEGYSGGRLSEQQLDHLLDDCVRSLSSQRDDTETPDNEDTSPRSSKASSRQSLLSHPPHLPRHVLDQLLTEARDTQDRLYSGSALSDSSTLRSAQQTPQPHSATNGNTTHTAYGDAEDGHVTPSKIGGVIESRLPQQTLLTTALADVHSHFLSDGASRPSTGGDTYSNYSSRPSTADTVTNHSPAQTPNQSQDYREDSPGSANSSRAPSSQSKPITQNPSAFLAGGGKMAGKNEGRSSNKNSVNNNNEDDYRPLSGDNRPLSGDYRPLSGDNRQPFLPAIDPKASLTSIRSNANSNAVNSRPNSRPKLAANVWSSVSSDLEGEGSDGHVTGVPHPPPSGGGRRGGKKHIGRSDSGFMLQDLE